MDLETLMLHELGHVVGLAHNDLNGSIMWPTWPDGEYKWGFSCDDRRALYFLYCVLDSEGGDCNDATIASWVCP